MEGGGGGGITAFILPAGAVMLLKSLWSGIPNCSNARHNARAQEHICTHTLDPHGCSQGVAFQRLQFGGVSASRPLHYFMPLILNDSGSVK